MRNSKEIINIIGIKGIMDLKTRGLSKRKGKIEIMIEIAAMIEEIQEKFLKISMRKNKTFIMQTNNKCRRTRAIVNFNLKNIDFMARYCLYLSNHE